MVDGAPKDLEHFFSNEPILCGGQVDFIFVRRRLEYTFWDSADDVCQVRGRSCRESRHHVAKKVSEKGESVARVKLSISIRNL